MQSSSSQIISETAPEDENHGVAMELARQWIVRPGLPSPECEAPNVNSRWKEAYQNFNLLGALGKPFGIDGYLRIPIPGARGEVFYP